MGQAKFPIHAYVDETGNTGHNLFDESQPDFFTAALVTRGDFASYGARLAAIATKVGAAALHAKQLGFGRIETIAGDLQALLEAARARFFISRVEKRYLLITKIFDTIFDSGENAAVAWHHYNLRPTRMLLAFKLTAFLTDDAAKLFWRCILAPNEREARDKLRAVCDMLLEDLPRLPDARAREIFKEGLDWARMHSESIQIGQDRKVARQGHFPNMVAFANLLDGLETMSKSTGVPVARITHDEQSEFARTLKVWHDVMSTAPPDEIRWAGETYSFQKVVGSQFAISADSSCAGVQVADVVLWLHLQRHKGRRLPDRCGRLMAHVYDHGWHHDFSLAGVDAEMTRRFGAMLSKPLDPQVEMAARGELAKLEKARRRSMARYEEDGIPPFMRREALDAPGHGDDRGEDIQRLP